ncbi:hypothetical protein D9M68_576240 [compost metagenome]
MYRPGGGVARGAAGLSAEHRQTAVVVESIKAELGVVKLRHVPTQRHPILPLIAGITIACARQEGVASRGVGIEVVAAYNQLVATIGHHIGGGEEGAAVVDDRLVPLQLVESLQGQVVVQPLGQVEHAYRNQAFLDLCSGPAEGRDIHRVNAVDGVLDEGAFTPADDLPAEADGPRVIAKAVVVIDKSVEQLGAG